MTKREFIKYSGFCSAALAFSGIKSSNIFAQEKSSKLWKWSKEAFYFSKEKNAVGCDLCPQDCLIRPDKKGDCRNRINIDGKLYSIAYGNPCAVHIDPVEKKPLYHFQPQSRTYSIATAGCNFKCLNCQNWTISQAQPEETDNYDLMPDKVVEQALKNNCKSISYTYSEPVTFYEYMYDTAKIAKSKGLKNIMVSAGYINEKPLRNLCKVIDAAQIDVKSFSNDLYKKLNQGTLAPVLNTLKILKEEGVWLEISNLVVTNWTDDLNMIRDMCKWIVKNGLGDCPFHFLRFFPLYKLTELPPTPESILKRAYNIAKSEGIKHVYIGNLPGENWENTVCPKCKKIVIERKGFYVLSNNIEKGKCKFCGEKISGVWN
jgi:pyruvate formate lyase activating enzyme